MTVIPSESKTRQLMCTCPVDSMFGGIKQALVTHAWPVITLRMRKQEDWEFKVIIV